MIEYFNVVNNEDKVVGKATREECHSRGLWHRAVHIVLLNSKNHILMQKRSMSKDLYKGYWIDAAAGHVEYGESYEEAAKRELKEELGIETGLECLFDFRKSAGNDKEFIRVFLARHDGPFYPNKDEIEKIEFFNLRELKNLVLSEKITPATMEIFNRITSSTEILKRLGL